MTTDQPQPLVCLDVAIDHRLRPLFKFLHTTCDNLQGNHTRLIQELGHSICTLRGREKISSAEVDMAKYLAEPATTGGICFVLQQPANNHRYLLGPDEVVESSPTLRALILEAWNTVSCHSPKPSIFDRLPFIRPEDKIDTDLQEFVVERTFEILKAKKPKVAVCMWKRKSQDEVNGSMRAVEGIGIGRTFTNRYTTRLLLRLAFDSVKRGGQ